MQNSVERPGRTPCGSGQVWPCIGAHLQHARRSEAPVFNQLAVLEFHLTIAGHGFGAHCNGCRCRGRRRVGKGRKHVADGSRSMFCACAIVVPPPRHSSTELRNMVWFNVKSV
jgi:hypothetical protein